MVNGNRELIVRTRMLAYSPGWFTFGLIVGRDIFEATDDRDRLRGEILFSHKVLGQAKSDGYCIGEDRTNFNYMVNVRENRSAHRWHTVVRELILAIL